MALTPVVAIEKGSLSATTKGTAFTVLFDSFELRNVRKKNAVQHKATSLSVPIRLEENEGLVGVMADLRWFPNERSAGVRGTLTLTVGNATSVVTLEQGTDNSGDPEAGNAGANQVTTTVFDIERWRAENQGGPPVARPSLPVAISLLVQQASANEIFVISVESLDLELITYVNRSAGGADAPGSPDRPPSRGPG